MKFFVFSFTFVPSYYLATHRWLTQGRDVSSEAESVEEAYGLTSISASRIIPTELNTYMYRFEGHLASMAKALGRTDDADIYNEAATDRKFAINTLMWNASTMR